MPAVHPVVQELRARVGSTAPTEGVADEEAREQLGPPLAIERAQLVADAFEPLRVLAARAAHRLELGTVGESGCVRQRVELLELQRRELVDRGAVAVAIWGD